MKAQPAEKESAVFLQDLLALNWDINFQALSTPTFDAAINVGRLYTCAAKRNGYCNRARTPAHQAPVTTSDAAPSARICTRSNEDHLG